MSIRPIDTSMILPKSQEMSNTRQVEISKAENISHANYVKMEKDIKDIQKKVIDTKEASNNKIDRQASDKRNKDRRKKDKENIEVEEDNNNDDLIKNIGSNIDIRI